MFKRRRIGYRVPFKTGQRHNRLAASGKRYYVYGPQRKAVPGCNCSFCCEYREKEGSKK